MKGLSAAAATSSPDAGVRFDEQVVKDMIGVRIGPNIRMAVVGSPAYFTNTPRGRRGTLTADDCINLRLRTHGLYAWNLSLALAVYAA